MRNDIEWLKDILDAIQQIEKYIKLGKEKYSNDELIQTWMIHHLQIIGEAANKLSTQIQEKYSEVKWYQIVGMRNLLIHEYFGVDLEEIWNTIINDIPLFKKTIVKMISDYSKEKK